MKVKKLLVVFAVLASVASVTYAQGLIVSVGRAPDADGGGNSLAISAIGENNFGFGLGFIFNSEFASKEILDYPVPHNSYTNLGTKRTGNTIGLDGYYYFGEKKSFRPYVGLGIYMSQRKEVAQSNATGWYYTQSDQSATMLSGEVGVQYVSDGGFAIGAGYHTVRGANLSIGKAF